MKQRTRDFHTLLIWHLVMNYEIKKISSFVGALSQYHTINPMNFSKIKTPFQERILPQRENPPFSQDGPNVLLQEF